jgi:hypothetical protein
MKAAVHAVYALVLLSIAMVPALADVLYSNGPINGTIGGFNIYGGQSVSDSFVLSSAAIVTGVDFGAWTDDAAAGLVASVQWSIGTTPGGSIYSGTAATTDTLVTHDLNFYTIDSDSFFIPNVSLGAGTYYLTLQNTTTSDGTGVAYWDINNGPSAAYANGSTSLVGYAGIYTTWSESFDIQGATSGVTPEPGYLALLIAGIVGIIWLKRRRVRAESLRIAGFSK